MKLITKNELTPLDSNLKLISARRAALLAKGLFVSLFQLHRTSILRYRDINIGRYAVATSYRSFDAYQTYMKFVSGYLKSLLRCSYYIDATQPHIQQIGAAFIDHGCYENGIYFELFSSSGIPIYFNDYPYGLVRWEPLSKGGYEHALQVNSVQLNDKQIEQGRKALQKVTSGSSTIPYLIVDFQKIESKHQKFDYVIYSHSFTDAQNIYGFDGKFNNVLEWLEYTVESLKGFKVCIKSHPGIYTEGYTSQVIEWDKNLFSKIAEKYSKNPDVTVIDYAVRNGEFLHSLESDTVLVSHHSNALLEGGFLGFKCICSNSVNWKEFSFFNSWGSVSEYESLLATPHAGLSPTDLTELYRYYFILKYGRASYFSSHWLDSVAAITGFTRDDLVKDPSCLDRASTDQLRDCIREVSRNIATHPTIEFSLR